MKQFLYFVQKETWHIVRDRRTMLIMFGMPVVMMLLFGFAISTDVRNVRTAVVTAFTDHETQRMVERLAASEYFDVRYSVSTPAEGERLLRMQKADIAVVMTRGHAVQIITDATDPNMGQLYSSYAMMTLRGDDARTARYTQRLLFNPQMRSSYNFVPGIMGMLLMLICAMMTSISIVRERERGTMELLLVSPVRPLMVICAKVVPYLVLAFVILASILLVSKYVLGVPLAGSVWSIVAVSGLYILVALSLGVLISTVARTQLVALLVSAMMLIMPCVLLSGMMFPIDSMPRPLQWLTAIMPPRYYIQAMRKLMIMGTGMDKAMPEVMTLMGMAVVLLSSALIKFNKRL